MLCIAFKNTERNHFRYFTENRRTSKQHNSVKDRCFFSGISVAQVTALTLSKWLQKKPAGKWGPSHRAAWCNIALLQTELLQMPEVMNYLPKNNQRTCKRILHSNKKNHLAGTTNSYVKTQPYQSEKACLGCFPASTNLAQSWAFRRCSRSACVTFTQSDSQEERLEELTAPAGRPGSWSKSAAQKAVPVLKLV